MATRIDRIQDESTDRVGWLVPPNEIRPGDLIQDGDGEWREVLWHPLPRSHPLGWLVTTTGPRELFFAVDAEVEVRRLKEGAP